MHDRGPSARGIRAKIGHAARTALVNTLLVLAALIITCLLAELGLRIGGPPMQEARFTCYDLIMGNVYCPGALGGYRSHGTVHSLRINADGLADSEHSRAKPAGVFRIALLGDSMVAGLDVEPRARIASIWEHELSTMLGRRVEVVNFSVPGTSTWEQLQMYHLRAREFRSDLVVLAFFWGNDVWNNAARHAKGGADPRIDDYRIRTRDRVRKLHRGFTRWLWNHSALYQLVRTGADRFAELRRQASLHGWRDALQLVRTDIPGATPPHLAARTGMPEYDWSSPDWQLTRELIAKLAEKTRADAIPLVIFQIPALIHVRDALPRAPFDAFLAQQDVASFGLFDLYDAQAREVYLNQFIPGDVHWNVLGHATAARHTLPAIAQLVRATSAR